MISYVSLWYHMNYQDLFYYRRHLPLYLALDPIQSIILKNLSHYDIISIITTAHAHDIINHAHDIIPRNTDITSWNHMWNMISCLLASDMMQVISDLISNDILHWYHVEYHSIHPHPDWMLPARNWFDKCLIKVEPLTPSVACAAAAIRWRLLRGRFARTLSGRLLSIAIMLSTAVYPKGAFKAWESKVCQLWATSRNRV